MTTIDVNISDEEMEKINKILDEFDMSLTAFMRNAVSNYIKLCGLTQEHPVKKSDELHHYQIKRNESSQIQRALKDNNIPYEIKKSDSVPLLELDAYISDEDFEYLSSVAWNHRFQIPSKSIANLMD